jgi:hypothetical protein
MSSFLLICQPSRRRRLLSRELILNKQTDDVCTVCTKPYLKPTRRRRRKAGTMWHVPVSRICHRHFRFWRKCEVQRCPLFGAIRGKRTSRTSRFCRRGGHMRRASARVGGQDRGAWRAAPRGCCEQHFVSAHNPRAVLLRQISVCDNQSHHDRENQQCREGFSDHWPRRMARSR